MQNGEQAQDSVWRSDWNHPIDVTVVEVCGNMGCNWFYLLVTRAKSEETKAFEDIMMRV